MELNQNLFKRLVQLEILSFLAIVPLAILESTDDRLILLQSQFDKSLLQNAGYSDASFVREALVLLPLLSAVIASWIGLLRFRRWGRTLALITTIGAWPLYWWVGPPASLTSHAASFISELSFMIWGAVLLLAYSNLGDLWFADRDGIEHVA